MRYADYVKADAQVRGRLARENPALFLAVEGLRFAAVMALVLVVLDTAPWDLSLGRDAPLYRLAFIALWSVAMAFWMRAKSRGAAAKEPASG